MRRGNLILMAAAAGMLVLALVAQRLDAGTGVARYWQHQHETAEDALPAVDEDVLLDVEHLCTHLPIVRIETSGHAIPGKTIVDEEGRRTGVEVGEDGEEEIAVLFSTVEGQGVWHHADDEASVEGTATFRVRGNSSRRFAKSNYLLRIIEHRRSEDGTLEALATDDGTPMEGKQALLGMDKGTKWALHGPFLDKTLIRNYLCMNLSGMVMSQWVPEVRFCELIIDGEYKGLYLLMEMVEVSPYRVDLSTYEDGDIANSYVVRIECDEQSARNLPTFGEYTLRLEAKHTMELLYPGLSHQSESVRAYTAADIDEVERMLYANDVDGWTAQLDLQSFVDYYLLQEFTANNDLFSASTYFCRDVRGRLVAGPVWDYNNAFNNYFDDLPTRGFILSQRGWFAQLMRSEEFVSRVMSRWRELRAGALSDHELRAYVRDTQSWLGSAAGRNFEVWGYSFDADELSEDERRHPGEGQTASDVNPSSYEEATEWMVNYMLNRARWMDEHIDSLQQYCHPSRNL